jgi:glucose/arabinose dehydrogenase
MRHALILLLSSALLALSARAEVSDPNWTETIHATDGTRHTGLGWAPDGSDRLFVLEQTGRVRVLSGSLTTPAPTWSTFATMSPIVAGGEGGLIGMAFDPDFARNHHVYFFVRVSTTEQQIVRYTASTNIGTDRTVIRDQLPTRGSIHHGGGIGFAGDGKLYWSIGDLGSGVGVNEDLSSLAAKVGRANRDGTLPPDNPFDDGAGPNNDFIYARGLRNPFTMQTQPATGRLWINSVGTQYEQVFVMGPGDHAGFNLYENNQPSGFLTPTIAYRSSSSGETFKIVSASRLGNISTFTTGFNHNLRPGTQLTIAGMAPASFNQSALYVNSAPSDTTFTALQAGPDVTSLAGGTATALPQGSCITGGAFYDSSAASADYRGNFFYGDCTSGRIMRARLDASGARVLSTQHWASGIDTQVDIAQGPDGALYYIGVGTSNIYRAAFNATSQSLVVGNLNLRIDEGGQVVTTVRLATAPTQTLIVNVARTAGDGDVSVVSGAVLEFKTSTWMQPQSVRLAAVFDEDLSDDLATVSVSGPGLTTIPITVRVLDLGRPDPLFADDFEQ